MLIKYTGKFVNIYFIIKLTYSACAVSRGAASSQRRSSSWALSASRWNKISVLCSLAMCYQRRVFKVIEDDNNA